MVFIGGCTQPGTIEPEEGDRHGNAVLNCEPARQNILPYVLYIQNILRRSPLSTALSHFFKTLSLSKEIEEGGVLHFK